MRELLFVCCTPGRKEDTVLLRSLGKLPGQRSLYFEQASTRHASCYNYVLNQIAKPDQIVVFVRDDTLVSDLFIQEKLNQAMDVLGFAVVGVAGAATFTLNENQPATLWNLAPPEQLSGAIEYADRGLQSTWKSFGPAPARCVVLDNALLAVDPRRLGAVRFEERFETNFHVLDFCLTAHFAGLVLGTTNVYVNRKPEDMIANPHFQAAQSIFRAKWRDRLRA
jgi:hypothetical protein